MGTPGCLLRLWPCDVQLPDGRGAGHVGVVSDWAASAATSDTS